MKNILTIVKKEFARFFKDKRMVLTVILPGVLIFALYSIMGTVFNKKDEIPEGFKPAAYFINLPAEYAEPLSSLVERCEENLTEDEVKSKISAGELNVAVKYVAASETSAAEMQIFYNSSDEKSLASYAIVGAVLEKFQNPAFVINFSPQIKFDLAEQKDVAVDLLSMLIPMLMFSLLASSCMAVAPEAIAGEKERGTMATMLITPIKRWQIALGKIISLSCFALISGVSSFLGVILSLPKLMGGVITAGALPYTALDYFMIFGLIISIVLVIISAFSVLSCFAKSVKESGSLIGPLMIIITLLGLASTFVGASPNIGFYLIPLMGSGIAVSSIMGLTANGLGVALAILSNFVTAGLLIVLLAFMFKSEKIMFKK